MEDSQEDGVTILQTNVDVQSQRRFDWQTTDKNADESLPSAVHARPEFRRRRS